jgi:hypothetical protein
MKKGLHIVNLLLFCRIFNPKDKKTPSGLPDCNVIFFVATKKTKQKTNTWKALTQGRILYFCHILKAMKSGKGVALRKEQGLFCILFVTAGTKRMASGGTRPAGSAFSPQQRLKNSGLTICCSETA